MQQYNSAGHVQARAMHERPEPQNRIPRFRTLAVCASSANVHALRRPRLPPHSECGTCAEATMVQFCGASRSRCHPGGCPIRWPCRIGPLGFPATVAHGATFRCFGCTAHTALIFTLPGTSRPHWCGFTGVRDSRAMGCIGTERATAGLACPSSQGVGVMAWMRLSAVVFSVSAVEPRALQPKCSYMTVALCGVRVRSRGVITTRHGCVGT